VVVHGRALCVAAMLIFQTQHLDKMKRADPKFHLAGHQPVRFGGQPQSIRRIAGVAPARQAVNARRVDEQRGGIQFKIDRAGELAAFFDRELRRRPSGAARRNAFSVI
jgi:hypothetical protein